MKEFFLFIIASIAILFYSCERTKFESDEVTADTVLIVNVGDYVHLEQQKFIIVTNDNNDSRVFELLNDSIFVINSNKTGIIPIVIIDEYPV